MLYDHVCRKCASSDIQRSRLRNLFEILIWPLFVMYRCMDCLLRQPKLRFIKMQSRNVWKRAQAAGGTESTSQH
jgi:hypothetical protein